MRIVDVGTKLRARVRTLLDRVSHTGQRRRAGTRAAIRGRPLRVLVLCYGNICRSPYAAAVLRKELDGTGGAGIEVESAGLIGPGRPANAQATAIASQRGYDLSTHRSRLFGPADSTRAGLYLVMTHDQRTTLLTEFGVRGDRVELLADFDEADPPVREIGDPYGKSDAEFGRAFDQIDRSVRGLVSIWADTRSP